jgi:hypothetical protein
MTTMTIPHIGGINAICGPHKIKALALGHAPEQATPGITPPVV